MARAIWKAVLHIDRLEVPVKLYSAVQEQGVHFRLLHEKDHAPVSQQMVSSTTGEPVEKSSIRKAYPLDGERLVMLDPDELSELEPQPSRSIEILRFVKPEQIDHRWYERAYFLGPDERDDAYFACAAAMTKKKLEGVARWTMRKKSYVGALRAEEGYLLLVSLRHAEEVVAASSLEPPEGRSLDKREIGMGEQLVESLTGDFDPADYEDTYRARVLELVETKAAGGKVTMKKFRPKASKDDSLGDALAASLAAVNGKKVSRGRR